MAVGNYFLSGYQPQPGEHMFAPTLQGKQFAIGSLETRRVISPKNPVEKKLSVAPSALRSIE